MSEKEQTKKVTLQDFIAKAKQKEADKFKIKGIYLERLEGEVMIQKIKLNKVLDAIDRIDKDDSMVNLIDVYKELVYDSVPILKSEELKGEFELSEPFDIVTEIFELGEILYLGNEILTLYGLTDLDKTVKN